MERSLGWTLRRHVQWKQGEVKSGRMRAAFALAAGRSAGGSTKASSVVLRSPRSVYIHIPFCRQRCYYCDFPIIVTADHLETNKRKSLHKDYFDALIAEIEIEIQSQREKDSLRSVYFGGGTPSLADPEQISAVLKALDTGFSLDKNCEITVEMDPGTFGLQKARDFQAIGVNRASVGAQTFDAETLALCGRAHSVEETYKAIEQLQAARIDNFSLDLIGGLPTQSLDKFKMSVEEIIKLKPNHVSVYDLIVEEGTRFAKMYTPGDSPLPSEDETVEMYRHASLRLQEAGFIHYETSNFARPGFESVHNQTYWRNDTYFGFGMGAASFLDGIRYKRKTNMREYISWVSGLPEECEEAVSDEDNAFQSEVDDTVMLGLRTAKGLSYHELMERFNSDVADCVFDTLSKQDPTHVLISDGETARLTAPEGFLVQNSIIVEVLAALSP